MGGLADHYILKWRLEVSRALQVVLQSGLLIQNTSQLSGQPKVTNLGSAILIDEYICWLDISVHDASRMDVLETAQHVVHDGLNVSLSQVEVAPEHLT